MILYSKISKNDSIFAALLTTQSYAIFRLKIIFVIKTNTLQFCFRNPKKVIGENSFNKLFKILETTGTMTQFNFQTVFNCHL